MIPDQATIEALHRRYAPNDIVYKLVFDHCTIVADIAEWCAEQSGEQVNRELLRAACLLHDIGTYVYFADDGSVPNNRLYMQHAIYGAGLLRAEGYQEICDLVETHVLMGLSKQEIIDHSLPLPPRDFKPSTIEGRLLCYADRFHSKHPVFNSFETFMSRLERDLPEQAQKFKEWSQEFGIPDLDPFVKHYNHPIK